MVITFRNDFPLSGWNKNLICPHTAPQVAYRPIPSIGFFPLYSSSVVKANFIVLFQWHSVDSYVTGVGTFIHGLFTCNVPFIGSVQFTTCTDWQLCCHFAVFSRLWNWSKVFGCLNYTLYSERNQLVGHMTICYFFLLNTFKYMCVVWSRLTLLWSNYKWVCVNVWNSFER